MFNVSFGSNYKLNIGKNFPSDALGKIYDYELNGAEIYREFTPIKEAQQTNIYQKMNVCLPDTSDINFEGYLLSKGIPFKKVTTAEAMDVKNIKSRIELSAEQKAKKYVLVEVDTEKFNEHFKKCKRSYIEKNGTNGIANRYKNFEEYLKTGQPITATAVTINDFDNELLVSINDGRHRFAYLRDLGMTKIPIAMSQESLKKAKEHGLV